MQATSHQFFGQTRRNWNFLATSTIPSFDRRNKAFNSKKTVPTVKHGRGSLVFWCCDKCIKILHENIKWSAVTLNFGQNLTFQQENEPKHTAKSVKKLFIDKDNYKHSPVAKQLPGFKSNWKFVGNLREKWEDKGNQKSHSFGRIRSDGLPFLKMIIRKYRPFGLIRHFCTFGCTRHPHWTYTPPPLDVYATPIGRMRHPHGTYTHTSYIICTSLYVKT